MWSVLVLGCSWEIFSLSLPVTSPLRPQFLRRPRPFSRCTSIPKQSSVSTPCPLFHCSQNKVQRPVCTSPCLHRGLQCALSCVWVFAPHCVAACIRARPPPPGALRYSRARCPPGGTALGPGVQRRTKPTRLCPDPQRICIPGRETSQGGGARSRGYVVIGTVWGQDTGRQASLVAR